MLLEGCEIYGLGSWADVADHVGGFRSKEEVRDHYQKVYIESPNFPLPVHASPNDMKMARETPREEFQARKKRRITEKKAEQKAAPPAQPKQKPTASVPSCHEVQGYMPGRLEFETEYANEAEEAVQHMQFDPGDGINPRTGELEPEMELKLTVMEIYNSRLTQRAERKKVIFEHNLLEYRKIQALDKKRTKEERDLLNKAKPFARMMNHDDFESFCKDLLHEHNLRQAINQLQDWRRMQIGDLASGIKYEQEKLQRAQKAVPMGVLDRERFATGQRAKAAAAVETPSGAAALVSPDLPIRSTPNGAAASDGSDKVLTNGTGNGTLMPLQTKQKHVVQPIPGLAPMTICQENANDFHLLTPEEAELCKIIHMMPKPYFAIKAAIVQEALKGDGRIKKKQIKDLCHLEPQKISRLFDFFVSQGWVSRMS